VQLSRGSVVVDVSSGRACLVTSQGNVTWKSLLNMESFASLEFRVLQSLKPSVISDIFQEFVGRIESDLKNGVHTFPYLDELKSLLNLETYIPVVIEVLRSGCPLILYPSAALILAMDVEDAWTFCIARKMLEAAAQMLLIIQEHRGPETARSFHARELILLAADQWNEKVIREVSHYLQAGGVMAVAVIDEIAKDLVKRRRWLELALFSCTLPNNGTVRTLQILATPSAQDETDLQNLFLPDESESSFAIRRAFDQFRMHDFMRAVDNILARTD
jgi:hypothetical protein